MLPLLKSLRDLKVILIRLASQHSHAAAVLAPTPTIPTMETNLMVEANPKSYKERQREARAAASAKRKAEKEAWRRGIELRAVVRRLSLDAAKATIRDRGDRVTDCSPAQLRVMADAFIGPWLVVQAKARIAERKSKHSSNAQSPALQGLRVNETYAQNGAAK